MKFISQETKKIFDGGQDKLSNTVEKLEFFNKKYLIKPKDLKPIRELDQSVINIKPDDISSELGLKIVDFDGMKIHQGSKRGLKLYYEIIDDGNFNAILVFSFGETQPGRFICIFEAAIDNP